MHGPSTTNGDGFGVGWYDTLESPGLYKSVQPAWNDANLYDLCTHTRSSLFIAHIRASTGTAIQYTNCHPFRSGQCLFVHNGVIREFNRIRRRLVHVLDDSHFGQFVGTTDSELMFLLAMQFGLAEDVYTGVARMVGLVEQAGWAADIEHPIQMTLGVSDGRRLYAFRYSSEQESRSLYLSRDLETIEAELPPRARALLDQMTDAARCVVSEPLSESMDLWQPIPESSFLTIENGEVTHRDFAPIPPA